LGAVSFLSFSFSFPLSLSLCPLPSHLFGYEAKESKLKKKAKGKQKKGLRSNWFPHSKKEKEFRGRITKEEKDKKGGPFLSLSLSLYTQLKISLRLTLCKRLALLSLPHLPSLPPLPFPKKKGKRDEKRDAKREKERPKVVHGYLVPFRCSFFLFGRAGKGGEGKIQDMRRHREQKEGKVGGESTKQDQRRRSGRQGKGEGGLQGKGFQDGKGKKKEIHLNISNKTNKRGGGQRKWEEEINRAMNKYQGGWQGVKYKRGKLKKA